MTNICDLELESPPYTFSIVFLQITHAAESLDFLISLLELIVSQLEKNIDIIAFVRQC